MTFGAFTAFEWFMLFQHELLLFAGVFFLIGAADEICMDIAWVWLRLSGRAKTHVLPAGLSTMAGGAADKLGTLIGPAAVFVPT